MKKWLLALVLVLGMCCLAEAQDPNVLDEDYVTSWFLADHEVMALRLGYKKRATEIGGEMVWGFGLVDENDPIAFGGYAAYHFPEALNLENLPPFTLTGDYLQGVTYVGVHGGVQTTWIDDPDERYYFGPFAGVQINKFIFDSVRDEITINTEVQYNVFTEDNDSSNQDEVRVLIGLNIAIP